MVFMQMEMLSWFSGGNVITGVISNAGCNTTNYGQTVNNINFNSSATGGRGYNDPELEPNSGHILYVENRRLISRASDQTEDIKIVVEF